MGPAHTPPLGSGSHRGLKVENASVRQYRHARAAYGRGDYLIATVLMRSLAERRNVLAQAYIGAVYAEGLGVPQDYSEAVKWLRGAAEQGYPQAQHGLAMMYQNGLGTPQDYVLSHMWFNLAAARYPVSAKRERDEAVKNRDLLAARVTTGQIADAQTLAREWKPK